MAQTFKMKRGLNANFASLTLVAGEPAFVLDTGKLYIGDGTSKILINPDQSSTALSANKLTTARKIELTGDITGDVLFDGSGNVQIVTTEKDSGVVAGTYTKFTVDSKGNVTAGTSLVASDIPTLTLGKISDAGTVAGLNVGTSAGNVPVLDAGGKLDSGILPAIAITDTFYATSESEMIALVAQTGDICIRNDLSKSLILKINDPTIATNWVELKTPTDVVTSVAGKTGTVTLTSSDVGLGNVTNESKATMFTSPTFIGIPIAPTAIAGTNTTQIATTQFVTSASANVIAGNVASATKLQNARTIALSGDVAGSVSFDGTGDVTITATVSMVDGGTF
jgi:hypothetical protein